ncbi:MAG TPA: hypothetical protein VMP08_13200, partial [Anaerolineae bacterium]|nr:hypothetical protein [Anaerolineae bacterium]
SREELPPAYHGFFAARPAGEPFPHAVLTPTFAGFMRRETEKLVCCLDEQLIILEKTSGEPKCTTFRLNDLNYVEIGAVLLKAWINLQGRANAETTLTTITLRYNAVTDWLFAPFIHQIRGAAANPIEFPHEAELSKLDDVPLLSFKFRNYARRSLLPGDRLIAALAQPEIRRPVIRIGRWTYQRTIATAHVLLLTDRELIIIRDDPDSPQSFDNTRYGGVWQYIPLGKIERITRQDKGAGVLAVSLDLPLGSRIESLFPVERRADVEQFVTQLSEWAPEAALQRA